MGRVHSFVYCSSMDRSDEGVRCSMGCPRPFHLRAGACWFLGQLNCSQWKGLPMGKLTYLRGTGPVGVPGHRHWSRIAGRFCRDNDEAAARTRHAGGLPWDGAPQSKPVIHYPVFTSTKTRKQSQVSLFSKRIPISILFKNLSVYFTLRRKSGKVGSIGHLCMKTLETSSKDVQIAKGMEGSRLETIRRSWNKLPSEIGVCGCHR